VTLVQDLLAAALADRYRIEREIGRGGMATVYLARDLRHERHVALKVLNPELGAVLGAERFLSEIRVTANLQHPNLLPLFDSGEADGLLFYVMPYVEGESLRVLLDRVKQLPVDEALRISAAIANALDYAHRHGVIHRDLKPENILLHEGTPLIADFGIALAVSNAGGERITQTGLSLGTPQYMSPEQATGDRTVDGRSDIYSLGAIIYEMLTGDPPHSASTAQSVIAKLLTETPGRVRARRPAVPEHVDAAVMRSLEKLPADRFSSAKAFAEALDGKDFRRGEVADRAPALPRGSGRWPRRREMLAWGAALVLTGWLVSDAAMDSGRPEGRIVRVNFDLPAGVRVNDVISGSTIAVSPLGDMLAFTSTSAGGFKMYLRRFSEITAREIASGSPRNLTFSPDGRWIAFTEGNVLKKVLVAGGEPVTVGATRGAVPYGIAWRSDGTIYVGSFVGLLAIPAGGGDAVRVALRDTSGGRAGIRWPVLLPGGKAVAFASGAGAATPGRLAVLTLSSGVVELFDQAVTAPLGALSGHIVYAAPNGSLMAIPFDFRRNRPTGDAVQLEEGLIVDQTAGAKASLSASGTLAYLRGRAQFVPVLARGGSDEQAVLIREPGVYQAPRFSPDGTKFAIMVFGSSTTDIWIYDISRNTFTRLTTEGTNVHPEWTPDGSSIIAISVRDGKSGIWRIPADGSAPPQLLHDPQVEPFEAIISPDSQWLVYRSAPGDRLSRDIIAVPLTGERKEQPIVVSPFSETQPRISPDGRWLAYQSNESGRFEIYMRPFPGSGARVQISDNGGTEPLWARSGSALYYRADESNIVEVAVNTASGLAIGERRVVLTGDFLSNATHANYDVAPDGSFLVLKRAGAESQTVVVHNWGLELKERTAGGRGR
jgi:eukaryotic-like serine/threonine-protein kinase